MRIRRIVMASVVAGVAALGTATAGPAYAGGSGCTDGFKLAPAAKYGAAGAEIDKNGDGKVCAKDIPAFPPGSENVIDNK